MKDLMIDLETLSSDIDAVVVQIGACYFNRHTAEIGETFKQNISINSCLREGFKIDGDTLEWWMTKQATKVTFYGNTMMIKPALESFVEFSKRADKVWSHATFDFSIMMNYLNTLGIKPKFHYRSARDIRTLVDLAGKWDELYHSKEEYEPAHDALEDCKNQVVYCVKAVNRINEALQKNIA